MAKQRRTKKRRPAAKPKRRRAPASERLARRFVAAWRRGDEPAHDLAKRLDGRARRALYRALIRVVNGAARSESEASALIVRAIELQALVEVATAGSAKLAAFMADD